MPAAPDSEVEQLVARYLPALRAFVRLRMGPELRAREESCDIVQSVAREVLVHRDRFRHGGDPGFRQWLFATAQRKIANRLTRWRAERRNRAREKAVPDELAGPMPTPSRFASAREEMTAVEAAFDALTPEQSDVLRMSRLLGLSHAEIAARLGKTEVAVRKIVSRGLARLAATLAGSS